MYETVDAAQKIGASPEELIKHGTNLAQKCDTFVSVHEQLEAKLPSGDEREVTQKDIEYVRKLAQEVRTNCDRLRKQIKR